MSAFFAIIKLTCRSAIRSNIFRFLLFLLILSVFILPNTIKSDGSAIGFIQIILQYSLGFVSFILSLSAIWIACSEVCSDLETGQLHLIAVKPVSRITVLFAKFCGVILIHAVLLVIAAAVVYGFVMFQYARQNFSEEEKAQLDAEVFVARKSFSPIQPDMEDEVQKEVQKRIQDRINAGEKIDVADMTGALRRYIYDSVKKQVIQRHGDVKYDGEIFWEYEGLPEIEDDGVAYLRYKVFPDSSTPNQQVNTHGIFLANETIPQYAPGTEENKKPEIKDYITRIVRISNIEEIRTSRFNEYAYPAKTLIHDGKAKFGFINVNSEHKSVKFQNADGPFLLIPVGGFFINYVSAVLVIFLQIFILALISASVQAFMSLPTAVFLSVTYIIICFFTSFLLQTYGNYRVEVIAGPEMISAALTKTMDFLLISLQDFFVMDKLSNGELIDFRYIGKLILFSVVCRGTPIFLLGAFLYRRRELGVAARQ